MTPRELKGLFYTFLGSILVAGMFIGFIAIVSDVTDNDRKVKRVPVPTAPPATAVDGPDKDTKRDDALPLAPPAQEQLEDLTKDAAEDVKGEVKSELEEPLRERADLGQPSGVVTGPLAAQEWPGCRTRFVRNFSSRRGATPKIIVWHQTVSRERGWSSQDALTAMANNPRSEVSWAFLIGRSGGRCTYTVPLKYKAWTQGNANPFSVGIEVEAYRDEPSYVTGAGEAKLIAVTRRIGRIYGIPMRRGLVRNCQPVRSGIIEHSDLGACGGGHADVTPWRTDPLIAKAAAANRISGKQRGWCVRLNYWRNAGRPKGGQWEKKSVRRKRFLTRDGIICTSKGPVRR